MKIAGVSEMRGLDKAAIKKYGIHEELLMENAGEAAYFVLLKETGIKDKTFILFCGLGNNGGDGFVIARKIHSNKGLVKVFIVGDKSRFTGAAKMNLEIISGLPIEIKEIKSVESVKTDLYHCDVIVDAIFGTGLDRDVAGKYYDVVELIKTSGKTVLSVDIPSGVHGDTGKVMGSAVCADYTVTFGLPKIGNMLFPGYDLCGKLYVTHISFPPEMYNSDSLKIAVNYTPELPSRPPDYHKTNFGKVLFIAGASSYFGAPYFAALSFLKSGGGYCFLAAPKSITPFIANKGSEIVFVPQKETDSQSVALENRDALLKLSNDMDMVVMGPGLSLDEETGQLIRELADKIEKPLLIDGDGITAICDDLNIIKRRRAPTILTPHMGEMSRIVKMSISGIDLNKIEVLQNAARDLNSLIVLKGAHSLIGYPDERVFVNLSGNSGMATAGSGDVLTGIIAGMYGLGMHADEAVRKGVFIHGFSGDLAAEEIGTDGMTAQDILDYLPLAVQKDRNGLDEFFRDRYKGLQII